MVEQRATAVEETASNVIANLIARLPSFDQARLNACFIDTLADGPEDLTEAILADFSRRGCEPGD